MFAEVCLLELVELAIGLVEFLVVLIEDLSVFVLHHVVDDVVFEVERAARHLHLGFLVVELLLGQAFFIGVIHLPESDTSVAQVQRLRRFPRLLAVALLIIESQLPLGALPETVRSQLVVHRLSY